VKAGSRRPSATTAWRRPGRTGWRRSSASTGQSANWSTASGWTWPRISISTATTTEKKDGSINQVTVDSLKEAFGWDGRDPFWLQDGDLDGLVVQIKLGFEDYNGKQRIKVQFVDAEDASPRDVPKADDGSRRSINTRLGAKFRALAGGSPAPAPKPTAARPAPARPSAPAASAPPAETASAQATMQEAWAAFVPHCVDRDGKPLSQEDAEAEWFHVLGQLFPGRQPDDLSPADWAVMRADGPGHITPF